MAFKKENKEAILPVNAEYHTKLSYSFLFLILTILFIAVLWIFRPFLFDIILAGILASFVYPVYNKILKYLGSKGVSAFVTVLLVAAVIIGPIVQFFIYLVNEAIDAYGQLQPYLSDPEFINNISSKFAEYLSFVNLDPSQITAALSKFSDTINSFLLQTSASIVRGTTGFLVSFLIILMTMYYLFVDGKNLVKRFMSLTPLPNKYDSKIFNTFREVSYSAIISTLVVAIFQGVLIGIGFWLAGLPAFFAGLLAGVFSILPYVGAFVVWVPAVVYLMITGDYMGGTLLLVPSLIASVGDNFLRAYLIKGKAKIHEMIVFFSIIGGVVLFGFWGVIIGPLIVALLFTVISIYEEEFGKVLEKVEDL